MGGVINIVWDHTSELDRGWYSKRFELVPPNCADTSDKTEYIAAIDNCLLKLSNLIEKNTDERGQFLLLNGLWELLKKEI